MATSKLNAVSWVNQQNMRILLEQITSELLIEQPDEPLEKILEILERKTNSGPSITSDGVRKLPGKSQALKFVQLTPSTCRK
mmetsp:Transcript_56879/g.149837  ORF Transcript_56879/g.149837 Transcript_56879/m.149837 type:complete len:82 (-) Transcript_56879:201-446(-)